MLLSLVLAATLHAGPEQPVAPAVPQSPYTQTLFGVAAGGDAALTVWHEAVGVRAARIDRDGRQLDAHPIVLSESGSWPVAVRGDGNWLVAWMDDNSAATWAFVDDDGTVGPRNAAYAPGPYGFDAAFDGRHFLLAWRTEEGLGALRLDKGGAIVEHSISIPANGVFQGIDVVAFDAGGFALVTTQITSIENGTESIVEAFRLDTNADLQSTGWLDRTSTGTIGLVRAFADGDSLVAIWEGVDVNGSKLFIARKGQPLRVLATGPLPKDLVKIGGSVYAVTRDGSTIVLISEDGATRRTVASAERALAASLGDRVVLSLSTRAGTEWDVSTVVVDAALQVVAPERRLTFDPALQEQPAVARNTLGEALVVWVESGRAEGSSVMAVRLDANGDVAGAPFPIGTMREPNAAAPQVVTDGTDFLVAWYEWDLTGARAHRVLRDGTVHAAVSFPGSDPGLCAAWTGTDYLIGQARSIFIGRQRRDVEIRATRLSRNGVRGETFVVAPEVFRFQSFNCTAGDTATLFAWTRDGEIEAKLVHDGGTFSGVIPIAHTRTFTPLDGAPAPTVAANGNTFLVAWSDLDFTVRWSLSNEHGTVTSSGEELPLGALAFGVKAAAAAAFEDGFVLAYGTRDLAAVSLDRSGHVLDRVTLSATHALERMPSLAGGNRAVAVYVRDTGTSLAVPYWRVFTRTLGGEAVPRRRSVRH